MFVQGLHDIFQNIKGKTYVLLWAKNNKVLTENWRVLLNPVQLSVATDTNQFVIESAKPTLSFRRLLSYQAKPNQIKMADQS